MTEPTAKKKGRSPKSNTQNRPKCAEPILTCEEQDIVCHRGKLVWVSQVIYPGREATQKRCGERDHISICQIMGNGDILTRSPIYVGEEWEHPPIRSRREIRETKKPVPDYLRNVNDKIYGTGNGSRCRGGAE